MFHNDSLLESTLDASLLPPHMNKLSVFNYLKYENQTDTTQVASLDMNIAVAVCVAGATAGMQL